MTISDARSDRTRQPIRSYVLRGGRITRAQRRALDELLPKWGLPYTPLLDLDVAFGRRGPRVLEIGFGNGATLVELARTRPDTDFLGIEVHPPGIGHCLLAIEAGGLTNIRLIAHDAVEVLEHQLSPGSLDEILLYFPDPWPKKRHHKRRIVQPAFAALVADRLKTGGTFHAATDWEPYALQMLDVLNAEPRLVNAAAQGRSVKGDAVKGDAPLFLEGKGARPLLPTRFEQRGLRLGHGVFDLEYRRR
jgi:tRNA (guanine-N7-)-methyltransferase